MVNLESEVLDHDGVFEEFHSVLKLMIRTIIFTKACTGIWSWDEGMDNIREVALIIGEGCNNLIHVIKTEQLMVSCILPDSSVGVEKSEYPLLELIETTNLAKEELTSLIETTSNNIVNQAGDLLHVINQQSSTPLSTNELLQSLSKYCICVGQLLSIIEDIRLFKYTDSVHQEDRAERLVQFFSLKNHMYRSLVSLTAFCEEMYQSNQDSSNPHLMVLVLSVLRSSEEMTSMTKSLMKNYDYDTYLITNFCSLSQRKLKDMELHNIKFRVLNLYQISKDPSCNNSYSSSPLTPNFSNNTSRGFTNRLRSISTSSQTVTSPLETSYNSSLDSSELSDINSTMEDYVTLGLHFGKNTIKSTADGFNLQIDTETAQELFGPLPSLTKGLTRGETLLKKKNYSLGRVDPNIVSPTMVTRKPTNASMYSHNSKSNSITSNLKSIITPIFKTKQVKPATNTTDSSSTGGQKISNKKRDVTFIMPSGRSYHPSKGFNSADSSGYVEGKLTNIIKGKYGSTNNLATTTKSNGFESSFDDLQEVVIPLRPKRFHSNLNLNQSFQAKSPTISIKSPVMSSLSSITRAKGKNYYQYMTPAEDVVQNKEGQITMGTLDALIERLTPHHPNLEPDPSFINTFMLTFRSFCTPQILLTKLINRFQLGNQSIIRDRTNQALSQDEIHTVQLKVCTVFMLWLEAFFFEDQDLIILDNLGEFLPELTKFNFKWEEQKIMSLIKDKICNLFISQNSQNYPTANQEKFGEYTNSSIANNIFFAPAPMIASSTPPQPILTKSLLTRLIDDSSSTLSILELDPVEIARQLTILECKNFCKIKPFDLFGRDFTKSRITPGSSCQSIKLMSQTSTNVTNMVIRHILSDQQPKLRAKTLKFYIKLAEECCNLRNYNTLMAIVCGLNSTPISRLKKTWKLINQKYHLIFENLKTLTDTNRNYFTYRNLVKSSPTPCLPFLGLYLTDLTFTDDGNPAFKPHPMEQTDNKRSKMVNFSKCLKTFNLIKEILRFQSPYNLIEVVEVQDLISAELDVTKCRRGLATNDIDFLYHKSLRLEPKSNNI
jgi:hypothetical protein